ncbi:MAG: winged helix-turn-helix domain-containing protein [Sulfolobaceae archaeon]|nr:winged helix-turn-helix domain-containing protein [Sulfolobaceae archaeon]
MENAALVTLNNLVESRQGNRPNYDKAHVVLALIYIKNEGPIGRINLMRKLRLGESTIKTMLRRMKELNLITVDKVGGALLTDKGIELLAGIEKKVKVKEVTLSSIKWDTAMIILKGKRYILDSLGILKLRDLIIRLGAESTLIAEIVQDKILLPPFTDEKGMGNLLKEIRDNCKECENDDLIIFITPKDLHLAYNIALELLE